MIKLYWTTAAPTTVIDGDTVTETYSDVQMREFETICDAYAWIEELEFVTFWTRR